MGTDRVMKTVGGVVTRYPSQFYEVTGDTTTKHLYAGNTLIGTIENGDVSHVHSDHLGSTNVVTDDIGYATQVVAYYPFGNQRIEETYGGTSESIQYVGTRHDAETDLNLMGARYADTRRGQFVSQDPVFWEVGETREGKQILIDPQLANTYSYARNNPITGKDPTGRQNIWFGLSSANNQTSGHIGGMIQSELVGYGQAMRLALGLTPGTGDVIAAHEAVTGRDYVTGEKLSTGMRALAGFSLLPVLGTAGDVGRGVNRLSQNSSILGHIFRAEHGLENTVENRQLITSIANNPQNLLGSDARGNDWYALINKNGTQTWVQTRDGNIVNGGVNEVPHAFNSKTGLSAAESPNQRKLPTNRGAN